MMKLKKKFKKKKNVKNDNDINKIFHCIDDYIKENEIKYL